MRHIPLDEVIRGFSEPGSQAARFNWNAAGLFVDSLGRDMAVDVSHILARATTIAGTSYGSAIAPALHGYMDGLAASADQRTMLARAASEVNAACDDRVGVRLGELMLAGSLLRAADPASEPRNVVGTLVLHAAVRDMEGRIANLLGPAQGPSAELFLAGCQAVQAALMDRGMPVPETFPERLFSAADLRLHRAQVAKFAKTIADAFCVPPPGQPVARTIAGLLTRHGGAACEEVLTARLGHLSTALLADLQGRREVLESRGEDDQVPAGESGDTMSSLRADYDNGVAARREQAIASALAGGMDGWVVPGGPEPVSQDAEAAAGQAPAGYDPAKGKWKTA